ncbi:MAG: DUF6622 family protein [Burkholderiaceae bacterium]
MSLLTTILLRTPVWVWLVLAALLALGASQLRTRHLTLRRATVPALILCAVSLVGVLSTFPGHAATVLVWGLGAALAAAASFAGGLWQGAHWSPDDTRLVVPGSRLPMLLFLVLFIVKFGVGIALGMQPALRDTTGLWFGASALYGIFSGLFIARALRYRQVSQAGAHPVAA